MCLLALAWKVHPQWSVLIAANRDELHARESSPLHEWADGTLGGRDLEAGGTWLGVRRNGRFAALTNFRDPLDVGSQLRSRGHLVTEFLASDLAPEAYVQLISAQTSDFRGFNLLVGSPDCLWYVGSRAAAPHALDPGVHTLSNHVLNTPWPKTQRLHSQMEHAIGQLDPQALLFAALADRCQAAAADLPNTGVGRDVERMLSAAMIVSPGYGTRCSTVLGLADRRGRIEERKWAPDGSRAGSVSLEW